MNKPLIRKRPLNISDTEHIIKCLSDEKQKNALRQLRDKECYPIVNRGESWYKRLTNEQKVELDSWYQSWLDVTDTLNIPIKPSWLK